MISISNINKNIKNKFRVEKIPSKCNILGLSYRTISILIAFILLAQNVSYVISFILRGKISCNIFVNGLYSLFIQFGDECWSSVGLTIAMLCLATNTALLVGALGRIKHLILVWYIGGIIQFVYLLSLQSFCLSTKSCHNNCELNRETKTSYHWGFGWCLFLTLYFYLTFIFKIQLFYSYVNYVEAPLRIIASKEEILLHTCHYSKSKIKNQATWIGD